MKREELVRKLNSVGKQAFVEHFELFRKYASGVISREHAVDELVKLGVSNDSGAGIRVGNAKLIFESLKEKEALDLIIESNRLTSSVMTEARRLRSEIAYDMRPKYDLPGGVRGKHHKEYQEDTSVVLLEPDVARVFRDSAAVNRALRMLIDLANGEVQRNLTNGSSGRP